MLWPRVREWGWVQLPWGCHADGAGGFEGGGWGNLPPPPPPSKGILGNGRCAQAAASTKAQKDNGVISGLWQGTSKRGEGRPRLENCICRLHPWEPPPPPPTPKNGEKHTKRG